MGHMRERQQVLPAPCRCNRRKPARAPRYRNGSDRQQDTGPHPTHSPLHEPLYWRAKRDPKAKMLSLQSFLRKGVSLGYVGRN